jgi:hypothetical protein
METIRIGYTDIIFMDEGPGKGKIIISDDDWGYNFSYYWGAMGKETIKEFVSTINTSYFIGKLCPSMKGPLDVKTIKEAFEDNGYGWYKHLEFQKDMREVINDMQSEVYDDRDLVDSLDNLKHRLSFYLIDDRYDRQDIQSIFDDMWCECWYMFEYEEPREHKFLAELHKKIKKHIKNEQRRNSKKEFRQNEKCET